MQCRRPLLDSWVRKIHPGAGIGYPLQYSWAPLVAQLAKNLPAVWETWVPSLGWEDPLEKRKATHSGILAWRIPWITVHGVSKSQTRLSDFQFTSLHNCITMLCYFLLFSKWISYIHTYILSLLDLPLSPRPVSLCHHRVSWAPCNTGGSR